MPRSEHLDYLPLTTYVPNAYNSVRPPCNEPVSTTTLAIVAIGASAAQGVMQVQQLNEQAKQAEYNAKAQAQAINQEANRQQAEFEANRRRTMLQQKRARSQQLSQLADTGFMTGTGTALEIEADTWSKQQLELADQSYYNSLNQRELSYQRTTALAMGRQQAEQYRGQRGAAIAGTVANMAQIGMQAKAAGAFGGGKGGGTGGAPKVE